MSNFILELSNGSFGTYNNGPAAIQLLTQLYRIAWNLSPNSDNTPGIGGGISSPNGTGSVTVTFYDVITNAVIFSAAFSASATYSASPFSYVFGSWTSSITPTAQIVEATGTAATFLSGQTIWGAAVVQATTADNLQNPAPFAIAQTYYRDVRCEISGTVSYGWTISATLKATGAVQDAISNRSKHDWMEWDGAASGYFIPDVFGYSDPTSPLTTYDWVFDSGQPLARAGTTARQLYNGPNRLNVDNSVVPSTGTLTIKAANGAFARHRFLGAFSHWHGDFVMLPGNKQCVAGNTQTETQLQREGNSPITRTFSRERYPTLANREARGYLLTQDSVSGAWKLRHSNDFFKTIESDIVQIWPDTFKNATFCLLHNGGAGTIALENDTSPVKVWFKRSPDPLVWDAASATAAGWDDIADLTVPAAILVGEADGNVSNQFCLKQFESIGSIRLIITNGINKTWFSNDLGKTWTTT